MGRRVRTYWLVRERYRRAANIATVVGAATGLALVVAPAVREPPDSLDARTLLAVCLIVLVAALVPRLIVRGLWRVQRARLRERLG